ncbi:hypothetical protein F5B19DRAFT_493447 [Rostrohypoxylon terebratum]|nr:hypothetical protein F5B19DRAFT_493447 [Rostrohypoxylon terebratum]
MYLGRYPVFYRTSAQSSVPPALGDQARWVIEAMSQRTEGRTDTADTKTREYPTSTETDRDLAMTVDTIADTLAESFKDTDPSGQMSKVFATETYKDMLLKELTEHFQHDDGALSTLSLFHDALFHSFQVECSGDSQSDASMQDDETTSTDDRATDQSDFSPLPTKAKSEYNQDEDHGAYMHYSSGTSDSSAIPGRETSHPIETDPISGVGEHRAPRNRRIELKECQPREKRQASSSNHKSNPRKQTSASAWNILEVSSMQLTGSYGLFFIIG